MILGQSCSGRFTASEKPGSGPIQSTECGFEASPVLVVRGHIWSTVDGGTAKVRLSAQI